MSKSKKVIIVKKLKTTFDKWMADPEIKERFDKEYHYCPAIEWLSFYKFIGLKVL